MKVLQSALTLKTWGWNKAGEFFNNEKVSGAGATWVEGKLIGDNVGEKCKSREKSWGVYLLANNWLDSYHGALDIRVKEKKNENI